MRITTIFETCIVCTTEQVGDWEHIIPSSIGGRLQAKIICDTCNHQKLGSELVSQLKFDPTIRMALDYLKPDYPSLYKKLLGRAKFVGTSVDNSKIYAIEDDNKLKIISSSEIEGVSNHDTEKSKRIMRRILQKSGLDSQSIELWVNQFSSLPENEPLKIPTGETFIKRKTPEFVPDLSTKMIEDRLPVLIAYEFLSLLIGGGIYNSFFDPVRKYILTGENTSVVEIERLHGKKYDVFHDIYVEPNEDSFNVIIRLFRWIVFKVSFHGYNYSGPDSVYFEQLVPPRSLLAITREAAREGKWLTM